MAINSRALTLEEFVAFNDELAAIVKAGIPLEDSLSGMGRDVPGRVGELAFILSEHLKRGDSLTQALQAEEHRMPAGYQAIVEAGLKAGQLPAALERLADLARELIELRRTVILSVLYPVFIFLMAYGLFFVVVFNYLHFLHKAYGDMRVPDNWVLHFVLGVSNFLLPVAWILPLLVVLALVIWWPSRKAVTLAPRWLSRWFPFSRRLRRLIQLSGFLELLSLLIEHRTPIQESLLLAGGAIQSPHLKAASEDLAQRIARGEPTYPITGLPAFACWVLERETSTNTLALTLRRLAEGYRRQAAENAQTLKAVLPIVLGLGIGGVTALVYALIVFGPTILFYQDLAKP